MIKTFYTEESLYPHRESEGENSGTYDLTVAPLEEKYRNLIPRSESIIKIGQIEKLPQGTLKCALKTIHIDKVRLPITHDEKEVSIEKTVATVGLYDKSGNIIGKELIYEAAPKELVEGIPEWKFDAEQISTMGTSWDYQSTDLWIWTVAGLRKDGKIAFSKNLS